MILNRKSKRSAHPLGEVVSALQKEVRRGNVEAVQYWLVELDQTGFGNWAWKRMKIMCSEDIGMASPLLPLRIAALYAEWEKHRRSDRNRSEREAMLFMGTGKKAPVLSDTSRVFLLSMGDYLCRCPKSRQLNDALTVASQHCDQEDVFPVLEAPPDMLPGGVEDDVVYHLACQLVLYIKERSLKHCAWLLRWFYIASRNPKEKESGVDLEINPRLDYVWKTLETLAGHTAQSTIRDCIQVLRRWHRADGGSLLWLVHAAALLCGYHWGENLTNQYPRPTPVPLMPSTEVRRLYGEVILKPIPDYALDKHTSRGKAMRRGIDHFFDVGCQLKDEAGENPFHAGARAYYTKLAAELGARAPKSTQIRKRLRQRGTVPAGLRPRKRPRIEEPPPLENPPVLHFQGETFTTKRPLELYLKHHVLAQLPTGHKPMARLGQLHLDQDRVYNVFLKGPLSKQKARTQNRLDRAKDKLPFMQSVGSALWKGPEGWFVIMKDLGGGPYPYTSEERKTNHYGMQRVATLRGNCHTAAEYLDCYGSKKFPDPTHSFMEQYLAVLFFRKMFGISDSNNRNIAVVGDPPDGIVYSVDETVMFHGPAMDQPSLFGRSVNKFVQRWVAEWIDPNGPHKDYIKNLLKGWMRVVEVESKMPDSTFAMQDHAPRKQLVRLVGWWNQGELRVQPKTSGERILERVAQGCIDLT